MCVGLSTHDAMPSSAANATYRVDHPDACLGRHPALGAPRPELLRLSVLLGVVRWVKQMVVRKEGEEEASEANVLDMTDTQPDRQIR